MKKYLVALFIPLSLYSMQSPSPRARKLSGASQGTSFVYRGMLALLSTGAVAGGLKLCQIGTNIFMKPMCIDDASSASIIVAGKCVVGTPLIIGGIAVTAAGCAGLCWSMIGNKS